jgi:CheY-like chemotaxis protein
MNHDKAVLLVVDDERLNRLVIGEILEDERYELVMAETGEQAWAVLQASPDKFDAVLLDRMMPGIDGIEVLRRVRQDSRFQLLPVIMQTAASSPAQVAEGLGAGAFYYLTKPYRPDVMRAVVATALRDRQERVAVKTDAESLRNALCHMGEGRFFVRSIDDARQLASLLSGLCPAPPLAHLGLIELLLNAIEHGNLGIGYDEKTVLLAADRFQDEIVRRLALTEYRDKTVKVVFRRDPEGLSFCIVDEGPGFDWKNYMDISVDRIMDNHGRGIAMSRQLAFSSLEYRGAGNSVEARIAVPAG